MKINSECKKAIWVVLGVGMGCVAVSMFSGCARHTYEVTQSQVGPSGAPGQSVTGPQGPAGQNGSPGQTGLNGSSCNAVSVAGGIDVICGSNPPLFISNGANGGSGAIGATGQAGASCTAKLATGGVDIDCGTNTPIFLANGAVGATGSQGVAGAKGSQGIQGAAGTSCSAIAVTGGVNLVCGSNPAVFVSNGSIGATGAAGNGYTSGLECNVYNVLAADDGSNVNWFSMLAAGTEQFSTVLPNFNVVNQASTDVFPGFTAAEQALIGNVNYALDCSGFINIPGDGDYTFSLASDDGSELVIDSNVLINMPQQQAMTTGTATNVPLYSGQHKFNLLYFQGPPVMIGLTLQWQGPANLGMGTAAIIPDSAFTH